MQPRIVAMALFRDLGIDEIDQRNPQNDGDLLQRHQEAALFGRRDFGDIHRRNQAGHADGDTAEGPVDHERPKRVDAHLANRLDEQFGEARHDRRDKEQTRRRQHAGATTELGRQRPGDGRPYSTAQQGDPDGKAVEEVLLGFVPVRVRHDEVQIDRLFRAGNHGGIITEQETAQSRANGESRDQSHIHFG